MRRTDRKRKTPSGKHSHTGNIQDVVSTKGSKQSGKKENKKKSQERNVHRGMVTLPYIRDVTEKVQRAIKKHLISTPVKPHIKLRQVFVHPKDRIQPEKKCDVIHEIQCLSCNKTYIGETGRAFGTRKRNNALTRALKQKAEQGNLKSAISDHCKRDHIMDWEGAKVIGTGNKKFQRWIREAVEIRKRAQWAVNRDDGAYMLSHTWDAVFHKTDGQQRTGRPASSGGTVGPL